MMGKKDRGTGRENHPLNKMSVKRKQVILEHLTTGKSQHIAAQAAGITRTTLTTWRREDEEFEALVLDAIECGTDLLEDEALRRAKDGVSEPVTYQGNFTVLRDAEGNTVHDQDGNPVVLTVQKYSDQLMAMLLKGRRRRIYGDKQELTGADGAPLVNKVEVVIVDPVKVKK